MKYTLGTVAKALIAFGVTTVSTASAAAHGVDLSTLELGEWLVAIGAGLTAGGGVFAAPNKSTKTPAEQVASGMEAVIAAHNASKADLERATAAVAAGAGGAPVMGELAQRIIGAANVQAPASLADRVIESYWQRPAAPVLMERR
jgi:hypothetical protein